MPFGYWTVRLLRGVDIRRVGSGNIGATNVWRAYGWRYGAPVMLLDVGKGFVPALLGVLFLGDLAAVLAGGAAMLGHWRPLFMRFAKGGKTVATAGGVFFAVAPLVGLAAVGVWIVVVILTRYISLGSMLAALSLPFFAWGFGEPWPTIAFAAIAAAVVALLHRANVGRLFSGTERRVSFRGARKRRRGRRALRTS
ncbi:MAG: glycerol-3-phosphate 1-O-acyltransferase PlsY [Actinomycetota bacterium]|nr:glycerol-3-phosphate 1-O-acyltransferase PlsY [Actinomycetota bacterium]